MMWLMLADSQRTALFKATILFVSIAATHAQRASAQTVHGVGSTDIVDANGNRVRKLFEPIGYWHRHHQAVAIGIDGAERFMHHREA